MMRPFTCLEVCKHSCCACFPLEAQYFSSPTDFVGYGKPCCADWYVRLDGNKIATLQKPSWVERHTSPAWCGCVDGHVAIAYVKVDGQREYELRKRVHNCCNCKCCSCCSFKCCTSCCDSCCSPRPPPFSIHEQPIYKCSTGVEVGTIRTIKHHQSTQSVSVVVPDADRKHQAALSILPMLLSMSPLVFFRKPTDEMVGDLMTRTTYTTFKDVMAMGLE